MTSDHAAPDHLPLGGGVRRGLALAAVSALLVTTAAACGTDSGDGESPASDPTPSTSTSASAPTESASASPTPSGSTSPSASESASGDPVPSPVINKAVKKALAAGFPALVPAGVPAGWTVVEAAYSPKRGGSWTVDLTDASGAPVRLVQAAQPLEAFLVAQLGADMAESGTVDLGTYGSGTWTVYTGDNRAAIATSIARTSALVQAVDQDTAVELAELLLTAEDGGSGSGDG